MTIKTRGREPERRGFTIHGRLYWLTKRELKSEMGMPDDDVGLVWRAGRKK